MSKKNAAGTQAPAQKKVRKGTQKTMDAAAQSVVSSNGTDQGADDPASALPETDPIQQEKKTMKTLTYKAHGKNGRYAFYSGAAGDLRIPLTAFADPKNLPASFEVADGVFSDAKQPKAKLTKEERKAAQAAKPKLTLAEKLAKREEALEKLRQKVAAEAAKAAPAQGTEQAAGTEQSSL